MITRHVPYTKIDAFLAALDQDDSVVIECHRTQYDWVVSYVPVIKPVTELSAYWQSKEQEISQFASSVW